MQAQPGNPSLLTHAAVGVGSASRRTCPRAAGLTVVELLAVLAVLALLAALLGPALVRARASAHGVRCLQNLRQSGMAAQMYWTDSGGVAFRERILQKDGGWIYWFGWLGDGAEGERPFDPRQGPLWPYLRDHRLGLCPELERHRDRIKSKAAGAAHGYAYNLLMGPRNRPPIRMESVSRPELLAVFADAAQINTFQPPASPGRPMLEEFYYFSTHRGEATIHFRHQHQAQGVFVDGHVERLFPEPGSEDRRLPPHRLGRLPSRHVVP
jgi:prepilin-type processing-associated H-X9-DG protein